ncbi:MAG TPA: 1-phosphofructokinase family hexose kinase [Methylomirabilota bacterium]|nr:1-phosphofructokinase family hexose kinase [Methylomirabilota bacterium]
MPERTRPEMQPVLSIATLTMNPAVDESTSVPYVLPDRKLRCQAPTYEPGGGGINVARAIRKLGGDALACFPVAGPAGELLRQLLDAEGVRYTAIPVTGWTRENLNVLEEVSGRQFRFCMPGAALEDHEWPAFLDWVRQLRPAPDFLVASGSLPPGAPVDFYARLAAVGRQMGSRVVLDTSGAPLARAAEEGVYLLKPSLREFQALMGEPEGDESTLASLAATAVKRGWCEVLVLSLGAGGALWTTASERERLASPAVRVRSGVGAGDSMVAGIVVSLAQGRALGEAVRFGVAAGAAAVMNPGTALCRREDVERLYPQVMTSPG